jgi:hypothetical protein
MKSLTVGDGKGCVFLRYIGLNKRLTNYGIRPTTTHGDTIMKRLLWVFTFMALMLPAFAASSWAQDTNGDVPATKEESKDKDKDNKMLSTEGSMNILAGPPAGYKKVSELTKLPEMMPGLGVLYVDPAMMPMGPYLGYDKDNKLINVVYMVPLKQLDDHKNFTNLGANFDKLDIDHTDIVFNAGHEGMDEAHYHIVEWLVTNEEAEKRTK